MLSLGLTTDTITTNLITIIRVRFGVGFVGDETILRGIATIVMATKTKDLNP